MSTSYILAVPGLAKQSPAFLRALADMADRHFWNADGIAGVMSHESGMNPAAKNPVGSATGLIQFIESTAKLLGTTTAALAQMTAEQQLPYVERFFQMTLGNKRPPTPEDYILPTYGRADLTGQPDEYVIDRRDGATSAEQKRYNDNKGLDADKKGYITVGDLRRSMRATLGRAGGHMVPVPLAGPATEPAPAPLPSSLSAWELSSSDVRSVGPDGAHLFVLRKGVKGALVAVLQSTLGIAVTAVFDDETDRAVRKYQTDHGLVVDGIVGKNTWNSLF